MRWSALGGGVVVLTVAQPAPAYTYESPLGDPCHEVLVADALRSARAKWPAATPLPTTDEDELAMRDMVFEVPSDLQDIAAVTLLIGVRDHDLRGRSGIDTQELVEVHGAETAQRDHCLRRSDHDEPLGSSLAVAECREHTRTLLHQAIDEGMTEDGKVDAGQRVSLQVHLAFRHATTLALPLFYVRLGQALHTVQDSFSHTFRTSDHRRITVALNWVDQVAGSLDESRDGPGHIRSLDLCRGLDTFREARLDVARNATNDLLSAVFDGSLDRQGKKRAVDRVLDDYMSFEAGCTFDNGWCQAPEQQYADSNCACATVGGPPAHPGRGWLAVFGLAFAWARRRW